MAVLVGLGVQASLFGPLKYGILPDHLQSEELLAGNGVIEATTFIAILVGYNRRWMAHPPIIWSCDHAAVGLSVSTVVLLTALPIPPAPPYAEAAFDWHLVGVTVKLLRQARSNKAIWRAVIGISWFWTVLRGKVSVRHLPLAFLGISLFTGDFARSCYQAQGLTSVPLRLADASYWTSACSRFVAVSTPCLSIR